MLNALHPVKANALMLVTDVWMTILVLGNELHSLKAFASMLITDAGMATLVKELHP